MPLHFLNIFFHITHVLIISLILVGWAFKRTRSIHLAFVIVTTFSWVGLGFFYGWGYCFWTDWHWQVRDHLGMAHPASYIKLAADLMTGRNLDAAAIDLFTVAVFFVVLTLTVIVNVRTYSRPS